ncbi:hypothetical protein BHM03_00041071 [Ensete ventricosum]|nr:hypothetical protein BHM03_00041071 [Ensete ventricosum]
MPSACAAALAAGAAAFGRDLTGWRRCPCWRPVLPATVLAGDSPGCEAAPCGLAIGSRHLWPGRGRLPLPVAPWAAGPYGLAVAVRAHEAASTAGGSPCRGPGCSRGREENRRWWLKF